MIHFNSHYFLTLSVFLPLFFPFYLNLKKKRMQRKAEELVAV